MVTFLLGIHITICLGLIIIVLIQRGRGGGLVESFAGVESMFGTRTSALLTKATTVLSVLFFLTCIGLAALSASRSKSLMPSRIAAPQEQGSAQGAGNTAEKTAESASVSTVDTAGESQEPGIE